MKCLYICDEADKNLSRVYLKHCLTDFLNAAHDMKYAHEIIIESDKYGKPYIKNADDVGNSNTSFSVSHSGNIWGCAVSEKPIGFDIQIMKEETDIYGIAERFFTKEEYAFIVGSDGRMEALKRFYNIWVRKEAYIKLIGRGISQGLATFAVACENGLLSSVNGDEKYFFSDIDVEKRESMGLCSSIGVRGVICSTEKWKEAERKSLKKLKTLR